MRAYSLIVSNSSKTKSICVVATSPKLAVIKAKSFGWTVYHVGPHSMVNA